MGDTEVCRYCHYSEEACKCLIGRAKQKEKIESLERRIVELHKDNQVIVGVNHTQSQEITRLQKENEKLQSLLRSMLENQDKDVLVEMIIKIAS